MLRLILVVLFVLAVLAFRFLPWWLIVLVGVLVILLSKFLLKGVLLWLFSMPFRAKGKVLRGATVEVHSVRRAAAPPKTERRLTHESDEEEEDIGEDEADEPDVPRDYYEVDVTITPNAPTGPFMHWEFGELMLVKPGKGWDKTDDKTCIVENVDLVREGTVLIEKGAKGSEDGEDDNDDEEGSKVFGPRRLKMLIGVQPGVRELVFWYYFESFGKLQLPGAA